ncbi:hypothetical protein IP88_06625 [alpha proteobacterium AAP81b]|nr:hypothetical protein IP88_06625 [alpha proteobacterium AAP81b]
MIGGLLRGAGCVVTLVVLLMAYGYAVQHPGQALLGGLVLGFFFIMMVREAWQQADAKLEAAWRLTRERQAADREAAQRRGADAEPRLPPIPTSARSDLGRRWRLVLPRGDTYRLTGKPLGIPPPEDE